MELTVYNIRRTLAGNLRDFAERVEHCCQHPSQIARKPITATSLDRHADQCIADATFCLQITAIDGDCYANIRDIITNITVDLRRLRKVYTAKNYICGQDGAIKAAKSDLTKQINRLWCYINQLHDGLAAA